MICYIISACIIRLLYPLGVSSPFLPGRKDSFLVKAIYSQGNGRNTFLPESYGMIFHEILRIWKLGCSTTFNSSDSSDSSALVLRQLRLHWYQHHYMLSKPAIDQLGSFTVNQLTINSLHTGEQIGMNKLVARWATNLFVPISDFSGP